jgi:gamma-glutamyl phosphate reductase
MRKAEMSIMTKRDVERLKQSKWHGEGAYIIKNLIETLEEAVEIIKTYANGTNDCYSSDAQQEAQEFLAKYNKED